MTQHDPRPPLKDLRWHTCTEDDPWKPDVGKRGLHPDAVKRADDTLWCPHCDISFPEAPL